MIEARIAKIVMVGSLAVLALLVTWNNLVDYDSNYQFVSHVLAMDTTFPGNGLPHRQVTSPVLWQAAYATIILSEGLTGLFLAFAAVALLRQLRSAAIQFNRAKRFVHVGAALARQRRRRRGAGCGGRVQRVRVGADANRVANHSCAIKAITL